MRAYVTHGGTLLIFVRTMQSGRTPWLARIENGEVKDSVSVDDLGIRVNGNYACDPAMMEPVLRYAYSHYLHLRQCQVDERAHAGPCA